MSKRVITAIIGAIAIITAAAIGILPAVTEHTRASPETSVRPTPVPRESSSQSELTAPFDLSQSFYPSGWMGDGESGKRYIDFNDSFKENVRPGNTNGLCIRIAYIPGPIGWGGMYWQTPDGNWGDQRGRAVKAKKIVFYSRGQSGGEIIEFKMGGINAANKPYRDSAEKSLGRVRLTTDWKRYEINLAGLDLSNVIGGFCWVATASANPSGVVFYLDNIHYE